MAFRLQSAIAGAGKKLSEKMTAFDENYYETIKNTTSDLAKEAGQIRKDRMKAVIDYSEKDEFLDTVKEAKTKIESVLEQRLFHNSPTGVIFNLKNNYNWKDKTELDVESPNGSMSPKGLDTSDLSTETLAEIMQVADAANRE